MKLKWTLVADIELIKLVTYVYPGNRAAALRLHERVRGGVRQLEKFPYSGRPGRLLGTREPVIGQGPYVAVYIAEEDIVVVHHILRAAQLWPPGDE